MRVRPKFWLALAATMVVAVVTRTPSSARYDALRDRADQQCRAYRADPAHAMSPVCDGYKGSSVMPGLAEAKAAIADAKQAFVAGDSASAVAGLTRAMVAVRVIQQDDAIIGLMIATAALQDALDLMTEFDRALTATQRETIFSVARFQVSSFPFEPERLGLQALLTDPDSELAAEIPDLDDRADVIEANDAAFHEMNRAIAAGDVAGCMAAATQLWPRTYYRGHACHDVAQARALAARLPIRVTL